MGNGSSKRVFVFEDKAGDVFFAVIIQAHDDAAVSGFVPVGLTGIQVGDVFLNIGTEGLNHLFLIQAVLHADAANVRKSKSYLLKAAAVTVLTVLLAWSEICSVTNDQLAMEEGRTSVTTIANMVAKDLKDEGLITAEEKICIFGLPAMNKLFYKYQAWEEANNYAKFGRWSVAPGCDFYSWRSTYRYLCGLSLNFCSRGEYYELKDMDEVKKMPTYPEQGSIRKIGEFIVVKVSDKY